MKIAIDLRPLQMGHQNRGIGSYLINIMKYFPNDDVEYIFLRFDESNPIEDYAFGLNKNYSEIIYKKVKFNKTIKGLFNFGINVIKPKYISLVLKRPDIFFQPEYLLGVPHSFRMKRVVVSYDLIPYLYKSMYISSWKKYWHQSHLSLKRRVLVSLKSYYYEKKYKKGIKTLRKADKIISISNTTTNDLIKIAGIKKEKVSTFYLAPSFTTDYLTKNSEAVTELIEKINGKYLIFIGGTDKRRKIDELVYAFNLLNAKGHEINLVLAGIEFVENSYELDPSTKKAIELSSYKDKIYMLGKISESDKRLLFKNALAFVYPTLYEGFGLPLLESMASSCPVITFKSKAVLETASNAAEYTVTKDGLGIYESVIDIMDDDKKRSILIKRGIKRSEQFSWDITGRETMKIIFKKD